MGDKKAFFESLYSALSGENNLLKKLPIGGNNSYVIFSDLHLGDGSAADNFKQNMKVLVSALSYYKEKGFCVILLGDIEEFHQFTLFPIYREYSKSIYNIIQAFPKSHVYRVFGNHDIDWALQDPLREVPNISCYEFIQLGKEVILTHGHQAIEPYEKDLLVTRFGTTFFRFVEKILGSSEKSTITATLDGKDVIYSEWAKENKKILICGHTHTPVFSSKSMYDWIDIRLQELDQEIEKAGKEDKKKLKSERTWIIRKKRWMTDKIKTTKMIPVSVDVPNYFNSGGCIFHDGITNIEIRGTKIVQTYWNNKRLERQVLWCEKDLNDILNEVNETKGKIYISS